MKITTKIKIYNVLSWILIGLTVLLAVVQSLLYFEKTATFNIFAFILEIAVQPYLWIALILRWRIKVNKKVIKNE